MNVFENQHLQFFHTFGTRWESWSNIKTPFPNQIWKNGYSFQGFRTKETGKNPQFFDHHWPHFCSSGECSPPWSCFHVDLHWVHYNGWHSGVLTIALPLFVFWHCHDVHIIDNCHSSDNYICICINSWEWWLCAWIQGSCMLVQFLVFRMFPCDDPSSERRGNKSS